MATIYVLQVTDQDGIGIKIICAHRDQKERVYRTLTEDGFDQAVLVSRAVPLR